MAAAQGRRVRHQCRLRRRHPGGLLQRSFDRCRTGRRRGRCLGWRGRAWASTSERTGRRQPRCVPPSGGRSTDRTIANAMRAFRPRIEAAKLRHRRSPIRATTFFVDDIGQRPSSSNRFFAAFSRLRAELAKRHEGFPTKFAMKHYPGDPMRMPTAWLTMRTLRHTCITALHDAGWCASRSGRSLGTRSPASTKCSTATRSSRLTKQGPHSSGAWRRTRRALCRKLFDRSTAINEERTKR